MADKRKMAGVALELRAEMLRRESMEPEKNRGCLQPTCVAQGTR